MCARVHLALLWCRVDVLFGSTDILVERLHCVLCQAVLAGLSPNAPAYAVLVWGTAALFCAPLQSGVPVSQINWVPVVLSVLPSCGACARAGRLLDSVYPGR